jgi:molybdenum cofactor cytidylyltransferase
VIQAVVRSLKASPVSKILVVLGHRAGEIAAELEGEGAQIVLNPGFALGMLTSVQAGAAAAPEETEWLLIALGDQPSLRPEIVIRLLDEASREPVASILVPSYGGRRGHPLLIHARHRQEIGSLDPEVGLKELLRRHPDAIRHVVVEDEAVLHDMDTPEEYERELRRLGR